MNSTPPVSWSEIITQHHKMPITRNQRNSSQTSSPAPSAVESNKTQQKSNQASVKSESADAHEETETNQPKDLTKPSSPQAPRSLRDRKSLATTKPFGTTVPSDYILHRPPTIKRPASTSPSTRVPPQKRPNETSASPSDKPAVDHKAASANQSKTVGSRDGSFSLLIQNNKSSVPTKANQIAANQHPITKSAAKQTGARQHDHVTTRPSVPTSKAPYIIEQVIQSARASFSSLDGGSRTTDLSRTNSSSPEKFTTRSPVRITLPSSPHREYNLSASPSKLTAPRVPPKQIGVINLHSSMLKRNQSMSSSLSNVSRDTALNLSAASSTSVEPAPKVAEKIFNVLIGVTGSVAAIKLIELTRKLKSLFPRTYMSNLDGRIYRANIRIKIVLTENSKHFLPTKQKIYEMLNDLTMEIHDDSDEWAQWKKMGDPVLHIELRKWADVMLIAPMDANTMGKIASGICDNLLTCIVRAWDISKKLIYCPAMNVHMYNHPMTRDQLTKLSTFGYLRIDSIEKRLACGDVGMGAMASVDTIAERVVENLLKPVSKISTTKQVTNKQPTYPIMSSPMTANSSAQSFISALQDKIHEPHQSSPSNGSGTRTTIVGNVVARQDGSMAQMMNQVYARVNPATGNGQPVAKNLLYKSTNGSGKRVTNHKINSQKPNCVTSLQNLQAISNKASSIEPVSSDMFEDANANYDDDDDEDYFEETTPESCNSEWSYNGFDPTEVLEQSLTTDDGNLANNGFSTINNNSLFPTANGSLSHTSSSVGSISRVDRGPIVNTTKFLDNCFDKARNCYTCAMCKTDYKNRKSVARHLKEQHIQGNIFHCKPCGMSYKRREKLIKHNRERHGFDGIAL